MFSIVCVWALAATGPGVAEPVAGSTVFEHPSLPVRATLLGGFTLIWGDESVAKFSDWLLDASPVMRRLGAEGLALASPPGNEKVHQLLVVALAETDPQIKAAVLLTMGTINATGAADTLIGSYKFDDGTFDDLTLAHMRAIGLCGTAGVERLLGMAKSGDDADRAAALAAFVQLKSPACARALPELLADPHLKEGDHESLLAAYASRLRPPADPAAWRELLVANPKLFGDTQLGVIRLLADAKELKGMAIVNFLLDSVDSSDPRQVLLGLKGIELGKLGEATPRLAQLIGDIKRDEGVRARILEVLRTVGDRQATSALLELMAEESPLRLRREALLTLGSIDNVQARKLAIQLLDGNQTELLPAVVEVLGKDAAEVRKLGQRLLDGKLPASLKPAIVNALRTHAKTDADAARLLALLEARK